MTEETGHLPQNRGQGRINPNPKEKEAWIVRRLAREKAPLNRGALINKESSRQNKRGMAGG